jgi:hypothetical protein
LRIIDFNGGEVRVEENTMPDYPYLRESKNKYLKKNILEMISSVITSEYRIYELNDCNYYIFHNLNLYAKVSSGGRLEEYLNHKVIDEFVWSGRKYKNVVDGELSVNSTINEVFINEVLVAEIGAENRFTWLLKCMFKQKCIKYQPWKGMKFDENLLDEGLAVTLLVCRIAFVSNPS